MVSKWLATALLLTLVPISKPSMGLEQGGKPASPVPKPGLTPGEVVEIQLAALQFNDRPSKDAGIAIAFQFASPGNREATGPLENFKRIVKGPGYLPMLNHRIAGYAPTLVQGDVAVRRVTVIDADGQAVDYEFRLSKDPDSDSWFTDGVIPIPRTPPIDPGKFTQSIQPARIPHLESFLHLL